MSTTSFNLRFGNRDLCLVLAALGMAIGGFAADAEPKTHQVFVGADISVMEQKELRPVEDVQGGAFVVLVGGKEVKVTSKWGNVAMKVETKVKVAALPVTIAGLKFDRAYTPENDPAKKFAREQGEQAATDQQWNHLQQVVLFQNLVNGGSASGQGQSMVYTNPTSGMQTNYGGLNENGQRSQHQLNAMSGDMFSEGVHQTSQVSQMQQQLSQELYDAVQVEFELTSPVPVRKPYVVLMARFHDKDAAPGQTQNWLYAAELEHLDAKPIKVRVLKGGFPPGYVLDSQQVHVYDGGHEIATNLSDNRFDLSRADAFKYLMIEYLAARKKASAAATPIMGVLSMPERESLGVDAYHRTYFVKVSKEGLPVAAFTDHGLTTPVDAHVAPLLANVRFLPALEQGKPVEAVAELNFSRLSL
ncbi:MAG TPA: hypothetical protein VHD32_12715 [Candidatus Didemnitutus sp.]|nr:hypothetical protein [Candidatus Didemnitutus sp.]